MLAESTKVQDAAGREPCCWVTDRGTKRRARPFHAGLAGVLLLACMALPSLAIDFGAESDRNDQTVASYQMLRDWNGRRQQEILTVLEHDRSDFAPSGLRAGNVLVFPSIGTSLVFDDNIFLSNNKRVSDMRTETVGGLRVKSQTPVHAFDLSLSGKIVDYNAHSELNHVDAALRANAALHFDHAHTISLSLLSRIDHQDNLDPFSPTSRGLTEVFRNRASIGVTRDAGRLFGTISAVAESAEYGSVSGQNGLIIDQSSRDLRTYSAALKVGYRFSPGFEFVGKARSYRQFNQGDHLFDSDALGHEALFGVAFGTSPLLRWSFLAGYGARDYDQPNLGNMRTLLLDAQLVWLPTYLMTVTLNAGRHFSQDVGLDSTGLVETAVRARIDYEILKNLVFNVQGELKDHDYVGGSRRDHIGIGRVGLDWYASKNWAFNVSYEHLMRDSNKPDQDLTRNLVRIGGKLSF